MTTKRDYYEVLNVDRNATKEEIKNKFRKLLFNFIPTETKMQVQKKNSKKFQKHMLFYLMMKKKKYDRYGHVGSEEVFRGSESNFDEIFRDIGFGGIRDIFEQLWRRIVC